MKHALLFGLPYLAISGGIVALGLYLGGNVGALIGAGIVALGLFLLVKYGPKSS